MAPRLRPLLAACTLALLSPSAALADERQLHLDLHLGYASASGPRGGPGALAQVGVSYGLNDAFTLYSRGSYTLEFPDAPRAPRHAASLSAGISYAFDHLRVVPYAGLGARADLVATPGNLYLAPSAEVRGGLLYLVKRNLTLGLEAAYAYPFLKTDQSADFFSIGLGVRFTWDL